MMIRKDVFLAVTVAIAMMSGTANADLTLELTGTPGSNVISFTAGGSITVQDTVATRTSSIANAPVFFPADPTDPDDFDVTVWSIGFDNELGDVIIDGSNGASTTNDDLSLSAVVPYLLNGTQFGVLDTIDLDEDVNNGDDIELDNTAAIVYPALVSGDVISWAPTSGTFILEQGNFEDIFNTGTFSTATGDYTVTVASTAVPEPSSLALLLGLGSLGLARRRR